MNFNNYVLYSMSPYLIRNAFFFKSSEMCLTKQQNASLLQESVRQKGPRSLPFIRRAAKILRLRDMASESKKRDRKR